MARPLRVLIVEDEPVAARKLTRFLSDRPEGVSIALANNGIEGLSAIRENPPDIVFLDIEMPGLNAFELLRRLKHFRFEIIFQTAYPQFAVEAFRKNACDYLLKPFTRDRFHEALDRAIARLANVRVSVPSFLNHVFVQRGRQAVMLAEKQIHYFISRHHHTYVRSEEGEWICSLSLSELEEKLDPSVFCRINRHCILNRQVVEAVFYQRRRTRVQLKAGEVLWVSKRRSSSFRQFLDNKTTSPYIFLRYSPPT